jgi:glycosyltransferase involved in cell wall biosynthesis
VDAEPRNDVGVVIPVYNEAPVIKDVVAEVRSRFPFVVCVDDGSNDGSAEAIAESGAWLVQHPINLGQGAALRTGMEFALAFENIKYLVTFDADGQHQIDDVAPMIGLLEQGHAQIVFGSRFLDRRSNVGAAKRVVLSAAVAYTRMTTGLALTDTHNGLRSFTREVAAALDLQMNGMAHASELLHLVAEKGFSYREVPVHIRYTEYSRAKGQPLINGVNIIFDLLFR